MSTAFFSTQVERAIPNLQDILSLVFHHKEPHKAVVVFDERSELSLLLTEAYRQCLPEATFINFDESSPEQVLASLGELVTSDLVVLIQSTNFRLEAFRIRVELFKRGFKVIEHPHLSRMVGQELDVYIDALAYDPNYYRPLGAALKVLIDQASQGVIDSGEGCLLNFSSPFEAAKLNVGDYSQMANVGGQFPIGEVFTEALDLTAVSGKMRIFAFGDTTFHVNKPTIPITLIIVAGQVVDTINSTPEFDEVLAQIRKDEEVVWVRELGFGLNRAFSSDRMVKDVGTFERVCSVHISLGAKHGMYGKPNFKRRDGKYHVDVFAVTDSVTLDDVQIYRDGLWRV